MEKTELTATDRPFAFVCSPFRGDLEGNARRAQEYCRRVYEAGYIPLAPHLYFPRFLDENTPAEREAGIAMGIALLKRCAVVAVCGGDITEGMAREVRRARELGIEICALEHLPPPRLVKPSLLAEVCSRRAEQPAHRDSAAPVSPER